MRCPKCGYISFDHLEVCLKCKKNISAASDALQGGVLQVAAPVFLNLQSPEDHLDEDLVAESEGPEDEVMDGDLDILLGDESAEESEEDMILEVEQDEGEEDGFIDFDISLDEESEQEIAVDPNLFDDGVGTEDQVLDNQLDNITEKGGDDFEIEMPEELVDMSDLTAPDPSEDSKPAALDSSDEPGSPDIELDGLDLALDLDSDIPASDKSIESLDGEEDVLSLGDIDFSDTISGPEDEGRKKTKTMDMDEDLNFDLDLGGLSIHDDI